MANYKYPEPNASAVAAIQAQTQAAAAANPLRECAVGAVYISEEIAALWLQRQREATAHGELISSIKPLSDDCLELILVS
jgi:hypothetical protein